MTRPLNGIRKRRWAPKERSGCKTCRIRKKKCDLTRPVCLRCSNGGYVCDGYETPPSALPCNLSHSSGRRQTESSNKTSTDIDEWTSTATAFPDKKFINCNEARHDLSLIFEPSSSWCPPADQAFVYYFMDHAVPLLSTTRRWHSFWSSTVPQACWQDVSVHHAMVALAAAYESHQSSVNRSEDIICRQNLAIRAFTEKPASLDVALILCRLLSSTSKRIDDWNGAAMHIHHGGNIIKEAHNQGRAVSELTSLMAPTFLCTTENIRGESLGLQTTLKAQQLPFVTLRTIHLEYSRTLRLVIRHKDGIGSLTRLFMLIAWNIMTQAMYSTLHPDLVFFSTENSIVPACQVKASLVDSGSLLNLEELETASLSLFQEMRSCLTTSKYEEQILNPLKRQLKLCIDNFVVQGFEIEPRMTAGTFWHDDIDTLCPFRRDQHHFELLRDRVPQEIEHNIQEREMHYLEFVCPYRSGSMPTFYS